MSEAADRFLHDVGAWAPPEQAAGVIAPGLAAATAARLLRSPRLAARGAALLAARLGDGTLEALAPEDRFAARCDAVRLRALASLAGAVWHAARLRRLVRGAEIGAFVAQHGEAARAAALRYAALAPAAPEGSDDVAADVARDGGHCVAAWIGFLPGFAAARLRLLWPEPAPARFEAGRGRRILRAVAAESA